MFSYLQVIHIDPSQAAETTQPLLNQLAELSEVLPGVRSAKAGATLPRALNGGQLMWRLSFSSEADYWACHRSSVWRSKVALALAPERGLSIDAAAYDSKFADTSRPRQSRRIWRCLMLALEPYAGAADTRQLERDLMLMPRYVETIGNWALGRAVSSQGRRSWTHVWEQEFDDVQGLEGPYMTHPIHWGLVDAWFDPECPQRIVDPLLIHAAFEIERTIIV